MARNMAAAEPRTLEAALMDQAQRIADGMAFSRSVRPVGKGMPMAKPTGLMRATEMRTFNAKGSATPPSATGVTTAASVNTAATISTMIMLSKASYAAGKQHGKDDDRQRVSGMAEEQHEFLNQRDLNQNIAGSNKQEEE